MAAYMKLGDIKGESTDQGHKDWILIESFSSGVTRTVGSGAKDQQRSRASTVLQDYVVVRELDKSSVPLWLTCVNGTPVKEVEIHLCTQVAGKDEPYLKIKLEDVYVTSYSLHGTKHAEPQPTEQITLNCTNVETTYVTVDPKDPSKKANVPGKYSPGEGKS